MKNLFLMVLIVSNISFSEIVNGSKVDWTDYPHIIKIERVYEKLEMNPDNPMQSYLNKNYYPATGVCTGFVVSESIAITAAHCVVGESTDRNNFFTVQSKNFQNNRWVVKTASVQRTFAPKQYTEAQVKFHAYLSSSRGPITNESQLQEQLDQIEILQQGWAKFDFAIIQTNKAFKSIVSKDKHAKLPFLDSFQANEADEVTLLGFGNTHTKMSEENKDFSPGLRTGKNHIHRIFNFDRSGVIAIKGEANQSSSLSNWWNEHSLVSWGDSGGPLALRSDVRMVIGITSSISATSALTESQVDKTQTQFVDYFVDINKPFVKGNILYFLKQVKEY